MTKKKKKLFNYVIIEKLTKNLYAFMILSQGFTLLYQNQLG